MNRTSAVAVSTQAVSPPETAAAPWANAAPGASANTRAQGHTRLRQSRTRIKTSPSRRF